MAAISIRLATKADLSTMTRLLLDSFAFYGQPVPPAAKARESLQIHAFADPPLCEFLLAEQSEEAVGFAIFGPVFWTGDLAPAVFLEEIYVSRAARSQGVGRALVGALARIALSRGWTRMIWHVDRGNNRGIEFYERLPGAFRLDKHAYAVAGDALEQLAAEVDVTQ